MDSHEYRTEVEPLAKRVINQTTFHCAVVDRSGHSINVVEGRTRTGDYMCQDDAVEAGRSLSYSPDKQERIALIKTWTEGFGVQIYWRTAIVEFLSNEGEDDA